MKKSGVGLNFDLHIEEFSLNTTKKIQLIDITSRIRKIIKNKGFKIGILHIHTEHTTSSIAINENEKGLLKDLEIFLRDLVKEDKYYYHDDFKLRKGIPKNEPKNATSHIKAFLLGSEEIVSIVNGDINLGKWQSVFFIELDGPRKNRMVQIIIVGIKED